MSGIFGSPKVPEPPPPPPPAPPPPGVDEARESRRKQDEMRMRRGRAATILSSGTKDLAPSTSVKSLLGD
jgi:hypothetical protein